MLKVKINNKEQKIPTSWEDVKFKDFKYHLTCKDGFDLIAYYLGMQHDQLRKAKEIDNFLQINNALKFVIKSPIPPKKEEFAIKINNEIILFPLDLASRLSWGQYEDMLKEGYTLEKEYTNQDFFLLCEKLCKMYVQPILQETDYDFNKIEQVQDYINNMHAWEIYSMGAFFLSSFLKSRNGIMNKLNKLGTLKNKIYLVFKIWRNSGFSISFLPFVVRSMITYKTY